MCGGSCDATYVTDFALLQVYKPPSSMQHVAYAYHLLVPLLNSDLAWSICSPLTKDTRKLLEGRYRRKWCFYELYIIDLMIADDGCFARGENGLLRWHDDATWYVPTGCHVVKATEVYPFTIPHIVKWNSLAGGLIKWNSSMIAGNTCPYSIYNIHPSIPWDRCDGRLVKHGWGPYLR